MENHDILIAVLVIVFPLIGAIIAGLIGKKLGPTATHSITIILVGASFLLSCYLFVSYCQLGEHPAVEWCSYITGFPLVLITLILRFWSIG